MTPGLVGLGLFSTGAAKGIISAVVNDLRIYVLASSR